MRVKRLEVQGFKSFKDKTVIHFDHSITGIVGPNGCGKSNIVDAFFWVMGEQSYKHIRGSGSDDLIFNGSSKHDPGVVAEATLVLETSFVDTENAPSGASAGDLSMPLKKKEVSVTRRVYRGGEGEYLINGNTARLKDIQELFMDTGVGAKGYSVIEQGQVGKIINSKPEDRRLLIEEAAGVAKYKARKKESLRKIEAAQGNLDRLSDIVSEIERNLKSLERQAHKAKRYKEYKDELLSKEMTWGKRKKKVLDQKHTDLTKKKETLSQEITELRASLNTLENNEETHKTRQLTLTKNAEDLQEKIQSLSRELAQEESALNLSKQRQEDLDAQIQSLKDEVNEIRSNLEQESEKLATKKEIYVNSQKESDELTEKVKNQEAEVENFKNNTEQNKQNIEEIKNKIIALTTKSTELSSQRAALSVKKESEETLVAELETKKELKKEKILNLNTKLNSLESEKSSLDQKRQTLLQTSTELNQTLDGCVQEKESFISRNETINQTIASLSSKKESLVELTKSYEGLSEGTKAALKWSDENAPGAFAVMADLFEVSKEYEAALEGWLEQRIDTVLTEHVETSLKSISHLKADDLGRVSIGLKHFDESDSQKDPSILRDLLNKNNIEFLSTLKDVVRVSDSKISGFAESMLSSVFLVRSLDSVKLLVNSEDLLQLKGVALVDLEGRVLDCTQSSVATLKGGSTRVNTAASVLGRKRAIQELEVELERLNAEKAQIDRSLSQLLETINSTELQIDQIQSDRQELEMSIVRLQRDEEQAKEQLGEDRFELNHFESEILRIQEDSQRITSQLQSIEAELIHAKNEKEQLELEIKSNDSRVDEQMKELKAKESLLQELKIREASLSERVISLRNEVESMHQHIISREERLNNLNQLLEKTSEQKTTHSGSDVEIEVKIAQLTESVSDLKSTLSQYKGELETISFEIESSSDVMKKSRNEIESKTTLSSETAIELEKVMGEISHLVQNLEEKYGPGCLERVSAHTPEQSEMDAPVVTEEMSEEEAKILSEEVEELKDKIRRLGEVNPMALEEYEELKGRFDSLLVERQDLVESIDNLHQAIDHINKTSKDRFKKAFESISERFEKLFPIIFGGGRAELRLVYKEGFSDILDAGVEILAQPPGKKVVNIGLLSGGEKALTAISLIFSIFMVKPSPFCVLDEVDAPLDDANIGRFNALLKEMSKKTQFILITHNKKTMELNDTLYGVTMEDPGVSKMVSIEIQ